MRPELVVLLGATAAKTVYGSSFRVTQQRGQVLDWPSPDGPRALATIHPSAVLRADDRDTALAGLVTDLRVVAGLLGERRRRRAAPPAWPVAVLARRSGRPGRPSTRGGSTPGPAPVLARRARGQEHPVEDFLFRYYDHRPGQLRRWSPGAGVALAGRPAGGPWRGGGRRRGPRAAARAGALAAARLAALLAATAARPPHLGCFGLHEWAMVHRAEGVRHPVPLRLGAARTAEVVETLPVRCTHVDAFRFFTPSARPLNALQPTRATQVDLEQPGCLHATMDLYRGAYSLSPWTPAELVADCFALARRVRVLDMRASPYDLSGLGLAPVAVETPAGRAEYAAAQRGSPPRRLRGAGSGRGPRAASALPGQIRRGPPPADLPGEVPRRAAARGRAPSARYAYGLRAS